MKKRALKIAALCLALLLVAGVCLVANGLVGNPISKAITKSKAEDYLAQNMPGEGYSVEAVTFDFKNGGYHAHVAVDSSLDKHFTLSFSHLGELTESDYEYRVLNRQNVANRLFFEYRAAVDAILNSPAYPYGIYLGFGDLEFYHEDIAGSLGYGDLALDSVYNVGAMGKTNGFLTLYIDSDEVTAQKAAEVLLNTKQLMSTAGIEFYSVYLVLQHPPFDKEKPYERPEGDIHLKDFLSTDIYEQGLISRVEKCAEDTREYYQIQNSLK